jgi:arylsulfatase A-like enzyme
MKSILSLAILSVSSVALAAPPNVVFVVGDDQAYGDYGFMGHAHIKTPHLDALAKQSLVFRNGTVPTSLCRASLATMVTGLYAHRHLITSNDPSLPPGLTGQPMRNERYLKDRARMVANFEKSPNLARLLGERGYVSFQSGKWWEGNACRCGGFTEAMTHGDTAKGGRHGDEGLKVGRQGLDPVFAFLDGAKKDGKPFFLWYAPMMPHTPHNPPERLFKKYQPLHKSKFVAQYWAMCEWFDETVGDLMAKLDAMKVADNTIVIYLHDNGWIQDETKGAYAPKSKRSPYDGGVRTPILVRWPGKVTPGESAGLASSIDLVPTALAAVGAEKTKAMPGVNLLEPAAIAKRTEQFGEIFEHNAIDVDKPAANLQYRWVRTAKWKLIVPNPARVPDGVVELYDMTIDPKEEQNVAKAHPAVVADLTKRLDAWWAGK